MSTPLTTDGLKPGFHTVTPYILATPATELIAFLRDAFGGEEKFRAPDEEGKIMHAEVRVGDTTVELSDGSPEFPPRSSSFHVYVPDIDAAYERALDAGATSIYPPTDQPYGDREGGVTDRFGNQWFIATHKLGDHHAPRGFFTVNTGARAKDASRLLQFLADVFGARERDRTLAPDGSIVHAEVLIGDSAYEISEARAEWPPMPSVVHLWVDDVDAVYARAMAAGATSKRPPADAPYGERSAAIVDPTGNEWYLAKPL